MDEGRVFGVGGKYYRAAGGYHSAVKTPQEDGKKTEYWVTDTEWDNIRLHIPYDPPGISCEKLMIKSVTNGIDINVRTIEIWAHAEVMAGKLFTSQPGMIHLRNTAEEALHIGVSWDKVIEQLPTDSPGMDAVSLIDACKRARVNIPSSILDVNAWLMSEAKSNRRNVIEEDDGLYCRMVDPDDVESTTPVNWNAVVELLPCARPGMTPEKIVVKCLGAGMRSVDLTVANVRAWIQTRATHGTGIIWDKDGTFHRSVNPDDQSPAKWPDPDGIDWDAVRDLIPERPAVGIDWVQLNEDCERHGFGSCKAALSGWLDEEISAKRIMRNINGKYNRIE